MQVIFKSRIDVIALTLIISASAVLSYNYFLQIERPHLEERMRLHSEIMDGTAPFPYRYRVLVPVTCQLLWKGLSKVLPSRKAFLVSYALLNLATILFLLTMLYFWLVVWFSREIALIGVLFVASTIPVAFRDHFFQPWSFLDAGLFTAGLLAIYGKRYYLLGLITVLAAFNRETSVFIPLAFLIGTLGMSDLRLKTAEVVKKTLAPFGCYIALWALIFFGLRYGLGHLPHFVDAAALFSKNTAPDSLMRFVVNGTLFLGAFWILALLGIKHAPIFVRRVSWIVPLYLSVFFMWGVWYEVRLLMPLYPLVIPLGLSFLSASRDNANHDSAE